MNFPVIKNAEQVLKIIDGNSAFIVKHDEENDLLIVNYVLNTPDTFPEFTGDADHDEISAIHRECRGIIFRLSTGDLISRRYHKFFNLGERDEVTADHIDWTRPHVILEKLDGSMITPVEVGGEIRYATKMGLTDVAKPCEEYAKSCSIDYDGFARFLIGKGYTPILEWCSRKQRIVVDYPEDALILTAIRHMADGSYLSYDDMTKVAASWSVPVVKVIPHDGTYQSLKKFLEDQADLEGAEGFVVRFNSGFMVKVKGEWYLKLHKMIDLMKNERQLIELILEEKIDDVLSMIRDDDRHAVERFESLLQTHWTKLATEIQEYVAHAREVIQKNMDASIFEERALDAAMKKEFAINWVKNSKISGLLFRMWNTDGSYEAAWEIVKKSVLAILSTNTKMEANRHLIGCKWQNIYGADKFIEE